MWWQVSIGAQPSSDYLVYDKYSAHPGAINSHLKREDCETKRGIKRMAHSMSADSQVSSKKVGGQTNHNLKKPRHFNILCTFSWALDLSWSSRKRAGRNALLMRRSTSPTRGSSTVLEDDEPRPSCASCSIWSCTTLRFVVSVLMANRSSCTMLRLSRLNVTFSWYLN